MYRLLGCWKPCVFVCPVGNWTINCGYEEALHSKREVLVLPDRGTRLARR